MNIKDTYPELHALRSRLEANQGKEYWRSLEELAETAEFREMLHREFPDRAAEWPGPDDVAGRRRFLQLMGASLALAGLTGCTVQPTETIAPYTRPPEGIIPGKPLFFATAMPLGGVGEGLLVESNMGRPTKVEGNPDHPASLGATDVYAQASVLTLYDPDRSKTLTYLGDISTWGAFIAEVQTALSGQRGNQGAGLRFLTETITSPTLAAQLQGLLNEFPQAAWHQYEPAGRDNVRVGAQLAFGQEVNTVYRFEQAEVILSLDADFLSCGPGSLRYARDFAAKRRVTEGKTEMNRLYVVESTPSGTGAKADHRWPMRAGEIEGFARAVAAGLGVQLGGQAAQPSGPAGQWVPALVRDLQQHRGRSLVMAGDYQPPVVHALAHAMNQALGNVGSTVVYTDPLEARPASAGTGAVNQLESLRTLVNEMNAGQVEMLLILDGNPVFDAPADFNFTEALKKVKWRAHLSLYNDETSLICQWHIPEAHYLEAWSDVRAYDGTVSIIQPLIAPLYRGKSSHEALAAFTAQPERTGYDIVRDYWRGRLGAGAGGQVPGTGPKPTTPSSAGPSDPFEQAWRTALRSGVVPNTALPPKSITLKSDWVSEVGKTTSGSQMEIVFRPDPTIYDGRFANNGWLQELPKPLTKLTWGNAALVSPATAVKLGLLSQGDDRLDVEAKIETRLYEVNGRVVELQYQGRTVRAPLWVMPGQADDSITVHLGHDRWRAGRVGTGQGFNAYRLRSSNTPWFGQGLEVRLTSDRIELATTQRHHTLEGRKIVQAAVIDEYQKKPDFVREEVETPPKEHTLYPEYQYPGYKWGMAIDMNACVGCNACVVACQAENNIPVVGKEQVLRGREMHWLRIDTYYKGALENPETHFQPMLCQHCENAPCELVCPVNATVHDAEGLNVQVYNRCVGTRYCSNNCPYKVRRFNFLLYQDFETESLKLLRNPEVSVRSRGVMEKCTYCVQRIQRAKIEAEKEDRPVRDGEIVTACQAACPAEAIVFGNLNDAASRVAKLKAEPRNYGVLADLNTRPRTTYLAALRNPNPEIESKPGPETRHG